MSRNSCIVKIVLAIALGTSLFLTGCMKSSTPVTYHNLTADLHTFSKQMPPPSPVLVGPVRVNPFLNQGPVVKQHSPHSVILLEQHKWAGNLDEMLSQIVIQNMIVALGSENIYSYPENSADTGVRVTINFFHFEKDSNGSALLMAKWKIIRNADQSVLLNSISTKTQIPKKLDYDALASTLSFCLAELSSEITDSIMQLKLIPQQKQVITQ